MNNGVDALEMFAVFVDVRVADIDVDDVVGVFAGAGVEEDKVVAVPECGEQLPRDFSRSARDQYASFRHVFLSKFVTAI